jgi:hypothetical protein
MGDAERAHFGRVDRVGRIDLAATDFHLAAGRQPDAGQDLQQFGLAIAGNAGDAHDLPRLHLERDVVEQTNAAAIDQRQVPCGEHRLARPRRRLVEIEAHLAADHQLGELLGPSLCRPPFRHHLAATHDDHLVCHRQDLAQLVGDQHDGDAAIAQQAQDLQQPVGLLRGEHRARFVQNENPRAAHEHLEDLDPLLFAHRQIGNARVWIDRQPVFAGEPRQFGPCRRQAVGQQCPALGAQNEVLQHGETVDQHEMLVDHADAVADGVARPRHLDRPSIDQDLAGIGAIEPVEDAHQGRLAGPVLTHDPGDAAPLDAQRGAAHRVHAAERLVDLPKLDRRVGRQLLHELLLI